MTGNIYGRLGALTRLIYSPSIAWSFFHKPTLLEKIYTKAEIPIVRPFGGARGLRPLNTAASQLLEATQGQQLLACKAQSSHVTRAVCGCALASDTMKPILPPQPGTVAQYSHHVMIRIPQPAGHSSPDNSIWWPPVMEKHPALVQAFAAVAQNKESILGTVRVTAYEHMEVADQSGDQSKVDMLLFPAGLYYAKVPYEKITEIVSHHIQHIPDESKRPPIPALGKKSSRGDFKGLGLFICTHMSRDTRCGRVGYQLAQKLQDLVDERGYDMVRIFQASHVGGHKFAGNVLVYGGISPCDGDWFGGITQFNAEKFLDRLVNMEIGVDGGVGDTFLRQFWRGRMSLSREEQLALFENPEAFQEEEFTMSEEETSSGSSSSSSSSSESESSHAV